MRAEGRRRAQKRVERGALTVDIFARRIQVWGTPCSVLRTPLHVITDRYRDCMKYSVYLTNLIILWTRTTIQSLRSQGSFGRMEITRGLNESCQTSPKERATFDDPLSRSQSGRFGRIPSGDSDWTFGTIIPEKGFESFDSFSSVRNGQRQPNKPSDAGKLRGVGSGEDHDRGAIGVESW